MKQADITSLIDACDRKCRREMASLTARERVVALASWASYEVELGGLVAFFHNSAAAHAREIVAALVALGAMDEAAAINQGRELLRTHSWQELVISGQFERLTDKFLASIPGLAARLAAYVEVHRDELEITTRLERANDMRDARA